MKVWVENDAFYFLFMGKNIKTMRLNLSKNGTDRHMQNYKKAGRSNKEKNTNGIKSIHLTLIQTMQPLILDKVECYIQLFTSIYNCLLEKTSKFKSILNVTI